jgi:hypothetical protein
MIIKFFDVKIVFIPVQQPNNLFFLLALIVMEIILKENLCKCAFSIATD